MDTDSKNQISCPHCDRRIAVFPQHAGMIGTCPGCGNTLQIPPPPVFGNSQQPKEITLVLLILDDSSSIELFGNVNAVLNGYDAFLSQAKASPGDVRLCTMYFNKRRNYNPFVPIGMAASIRPTYRPTRGTPLYRRMRDALLFLTETAQTWATKGYAVRTITILFADGQDNDRTVQANDVRTQIDQMKTAGTHIIAARGVNYPNIDFYAVFRGMGIDHQHIQILPDGHEIVTSMASTGGGVSTASMDLQRFNDTMQFGLGHATEPEA